MSNSPDDLRYTKTQEWVRRRDAQVEVGITDFAQRQLSDITFLELPEVGGKFGAGDEAGIVESIKAASDVYAPVAGVITEVNVSLVAAPETINSDPYGQGWLFKMKPDNMDEVVRLMDVEQYEVSLPEKH